MALRVPATPFFHKKILDFFSPLLCQIIFPSCFDTYLFFWNNPAFEFFLRFVKLFLLNVFKPFHFFVGLPNALSLRSTIVHEGERYSTHKLEQDLPPRVKWATPTNEILSRIIMFSLGAPRRDTAPDILKLEWVWIGIINHSIKIYRNFNMVTGYRLMKPSSVCVSYTL